MWSPRATAIRRTPRGEWLRAWRFRPGLRWLSHEPPALAERLHDGTWRDVTKQRCFSHAETEAAGLVFQHFAYATAEQVSFKERYYGYAGAMEGWRRLQTEGSLPAPLKNAFPWVKDDTMVNTAAHAGITPLARRDPAGGAWTFLSQAPREPVGAGKEPVIVVDGIFFQFNNTGIARVWLETLRHWAASGFARHVRLLDRAGTAPQIEGILTRRIPGYDPKNPGDDAFMVQRVCDELGAGVFISSYYTSPVRTPSVAMIYDMIPELLGEEKEAWAWRQKDVALLQARRIVCISESTARDLIQLRPEVPRERVVVTHLAAPPEFSPPDSGTIASFRKRHGLGKDYLMVAGERVGIHLGNQGYKNASLAFKAWSLLPADERSSLAILCTGGRPELEEELRVLAPDADVRVIRLTDEDLSTAYGAAVALVYPSLYEGFGLPVIEAMACGCPVITCNRASLTEVAGDATLMVDPWDAKAASAAIRSLRLDETLRARHIAAGRTQAARFSFPGMAAELAAVLRETALAGRTQEQASIGGVLEKFRALQSAEFNLRQTAAAQNARRAKVEKQLKQLEKSLAAMERRIQKERERERRRRPLKRLWDRIRGKRRT